MWGINQELYCIQDRTTWSAGSDFRKIYQKTKRRPHTSCQEFFQVVVCTYDTVYCFQYTVYH